MTVAALALLVVLSGADVATTHLLLARGAVEANPLAGLLIAKSALLWAKLGIIAVLGVFVLQGRPRIGVMAGAWLVCGLYAAAVLSNILILRMI
jgi:hypothetical protein